MRDAGTDTGAGAGAGAGDALIVMRDIVKVFPPAVVALDGADVRIAPGRVHSIIGENGAGKTTLMRIFYGLMGCDAGEIYHRGRRAAFSSPSEAVAAGIGMVHQEFMLVPSYRVLENIILGAEPRKLRERRGLGWLGGGIDWAGAEARTTALMEKYGLVVDLHARVHTLSVAAQQKIEILKLLCRDVDVLILDEPTAVLTPQESQQLFVRIRSLIDEGKTVIFISHKLDEVLEISDDISVMRKGRRVATLGNKNVTRKQLATMMVGREVMFAIDVPKIPAGEVVLDVRGVAAPPAGDGQGINIKNMQVRRNEIVGIAGLEGSGQLALIEVLVGLRGPSAGVISMAGEDVTGDSTMERRRRLAYVPQDRRYAGTSQDDSLIDNIIMGHHRQDSSLVDKRGWFLLRGQCRELSGRIMHDFQVTHANLDQEIANLSGGNQQKVILGRECSLHQPLLVLDQPTRGLDVGSIEYIQHRIIDMRAQGCACLLLSADLDELLSLADRLLVLYRGEIVAEFNRSEADRLTVGQYMLGAHAE